MKKIVLLTLSLSLVTALSFGKPKIEIEKVISKEIPVRPPVAYPSSRIDRPLILPHELLNGEAQVDYHYF